jgi:hypothetical protein
MIWLRLVLQAVALVLWVVADPGEVPWAASLAFGAMLGAMLTVSIVEMRNRRS